MVYYIKCAECGSKYKEKEQTENAALGAQKTKVVI